VTDRDRDNEYVRRMEAIPRPAPKDSLPVYSLSPEACLKKWRPLAGSGAQALRIATVIEDEVRWWQRKGYKAPFLKWVIPALRMAVERLMEAASEEEIESAVTASVMNVIQFSDGNVVERVAALELIENREWLDYVKGLAPRVQRSLRRVTE
jgi:hypothetical protein